MVSNPNGYRGSRTDEFEQLYMADTPSRQHSLTSLQMPASNLPINNMSPSLAEVEVGVNKLKKGGKASGIFNISVAENKRRSNEP